MHHCFRRDVGCHHHVDVAHSYMSGNQLNGYTVSSSSGVNYDALLAGDPGAAPEPATWALAGGALLIGMGMRRRRRAVL